MASNTYRVRWEAEAQADFLDAMEYFAKLDRGYGQGPILTLAFEAEIDRLMDRISADPGHFPVVGAYRRAISGNRFRYLAFFSVDADARTLWVKLLKGPGQNAPPWPYGKS